MIHLALGPIKISLDGISEKEIPINSRLFIDKTQTKSNIHYIFKFVETLPEPKKEWKIVFQRTDIEVLKNNNLEMRRIGIKDTPNSSYALSQEINEKEIEIYFLEKKKELLTTDTIFISCLSLERYMAQCKALILHCAFLAYKDKAILFSGPSGIGKSTHSELWCKHIDETKMINGDRCLIYRNKDGVYMASGWPVCGSSNICHREEYPLRNIIFMYQGEKNTILQGSHMQLFKQLSSQTTVNWWNKSVAEQILDELQLLLNTVPIYNYACNISPEAPILLRNCIEKTSGNK